MPEQPEKPVYSYTGRLIGFCQAPCEDRVHLRRGQHPARLPGWRYLNWMDVLDAARERNRIALMRHINRCMKNAP